jgi:hypothetical protein
MRFRCFDRVSILWSRTPVPVVAVLVLLLPIGPAGVMLGGREARQQRSEQSLSRIAAVAGCRLTEFGGDMDTNPPVTGRFVERIRAADGSYAHRRPPRLLATTHALLHGRVLLQYRPGLGSRELEALDGMVRKDSDKVLLFENQTRMPARIAATAYLSLMTCPRVDRRTLRALDAFRARRRAFGQSF